MPIISTGLIGGAIATGLAAHKLRSSKSSRPAFLLAAPEKEPRSELVEKVTEVAAKLDEAYQAFIVEYVDPIFGSNRYKQLETIASGPRIIDISPDERELNTNLAYAGLGFGASVVARLFFPPLYLVSLGMGIYIARIPAKRAYDGLTKEKRVKLPVVVTLNLLGTFLGGYFIVGSLGLVVYFISEKLVIITQDRSHKNLINVFGQQPQSVWVLIGDTEVKIPFEELQAGDLIMIHVGETIPVDGTVTQGIATIDQKALTGEAQPAEKAVGDRVYAATVVLSGKLCVEVGETGESTLAARIGDILNNTTGYQMSIESKGMTLAHDLSLPTLLLGLGAWALVSYPAMIAILGASIGFNIKITGPIAMLNFLNISSKHGILVKDGRSLELLHEIDTIIFDKTGTLTLEQPEVIKVHTCGNLNEQQVLTYTAAAEYRQSHPIAQAILTAADEWGLSLPTIDEAAYEIGYGIQVQIDTDQVYVGSERYLVKQDIAIPASMHEVKEHSHANGHSLVMVAVDDTLVGAIELQPTLRPEAKEVINILRQRGLDMVIISGDQEQPTRNLAQELGLERYFANTLPEDKAGHVEKLQSEGRSVCFVGDGINDSIALKTANVSISLRGATTAATDTAQIILMAESLAQLPFLFNIGDEFDQNMNIGFAAAIIPGLMIIGGAFLGLVGIAGSLIIYNASLLAGLSIASYPLIKERSEQTNNLLERISTTNDA